MGNSGSSPKGSLPLAGRSYPSSPPLSPKGAGPAVDLWLSGGPPHRFPTTTTGAADADVLNGGNAASADFLGELPIELAARVAHFLGEADIKSVRLVCRGWNHVANSELVWKHLTRLRWPTLQRTPAMVRSWRDAHKIVWLGVRVANRKGTSELINYLAAYGFISSRLDVREEAMLLDTIRGIHPRTVGARLSETVAETDEGLLRSPLMEAFVQRQDYRNVFLPEALRMLFAKARTPGHSSMTISPALHYFVAQYMAHNPDGSPGSGRPPLAHDAERLNVITLCYAMILLSVDLYNDNVKSKMSRREFIRNNGFMGYPDEYLMRIYENVYMWGHIAEPKRTSLRHELNRKTISRLL
mmetsp:Transcript_4880/g.12574  ORF Transcript_4880/g.12574 Transcript_4880/m.12574 type:complete len:356 (-) Transcript_4880:90-1157(-)